MDQNKIHCFDPELQLLGLGKISVPLLSSLGNLLKMHTLFSHTHTQSVNNFEIAHKTC